MTQHAHKQENATGDTGKVLDAALAYVAQYGWAVFPARFKDGNKLSWKSADSSNGQPWGMTCITDDIRSDFAPSGRDAIGVPTGAVNGIFVVEADTLAGHNVDGARVPEPRWKPSSAARYRETLMVVSPHPGRCIATTRTPGRQKDQACTTIAPGVDVKGDGGMVIAPPSMRPGKGAYRWLNALPIAAAPPWLIARVTASEQRHTGDEPEADESRVALALAMIPNDDLDWDDWNRVGMAVWRATGGSDLGRDAFDAWSQKSGKYNAKTTAAKWTKYFSSPPTHIGAGTIFHLANEARPGWEDDLDAADVAALIAAFRAVMDGGEWVAPQATKPDQEDEDPEQVKVNAGIVATAYDFPAEETIAPYDWLLGKHLLRGEVAGSAATGGSGKSSLAIVEALAMASGRQLLHDHVNSSLPPRVVLINLEDKRNIMDKRIAAAMRHYNLTKADIEDRLIVLARGEIKIKVADQSRTGVARDPKIIKSLTAFMLEKHADVLSIDSFIRTHGVNENDNSAIEEVVECYEYIATKANCAVHLWHHTRKMGGDKVSVEAARGAQSFIDACRSVRILETMSRAERDKLMAIVPNMKEAGYYFRAFNGKRNFAPPSDQSDWFMFESVELRNDPDGFIGGGDNVGVVTPWQYPKIELPSITEAAISQALAAVAAGGPWRADQRSRKEPWVGVPIAQGGLGPAGCARSHGLIGTGRSANTLRLPQQSNCGS